MNQSKEVYETRNRIVFYAMANNRLRSDKRTDTAVAVKFGVSRERVRQIFLTGWWRKGGKARLRAIFYRQCHLDYIREWKEWEQEARVGDAGLYFNRSREFTEHAKRILVI